MFSLSLIPFHSYGAGKKARHQLPAFKYPTSAQVVCWLDRLGWRQGFVGLFFVACLWGRFASRILYYRPLLNLKNTFGCSKFKRKVLLHSSSHFLIKKLTRSRLNTGLNTFLGFDTFITVVKPASTPKTPVNLTASYFVVPVCSYYYGNAVPAQNSK